MTSAALKSLTMTAFRGSSATFKLDFEKGKKLTLIYGENGTGKTTICDAFESSLLIRLARLRTEAWVRAWINSGQVQEKPCRLFTSFGDECRKMRGQSCKQESLGLAADSSPAY